MKTITRLAAIPTLLIILTVSARATEHYVNLNNPTPAPPYTDWSSAATTIQDAIDVSDSGDLILVTNGVYQTGGRVATLAGFYGSLLNRVLIDKPVTVQSVNGSSATIIQGYQVPGMTNGNGAVRCVFLTNNAALIGFTLTLGATLTSGYSFDKSGGGAYCRPGVVISNCVFIGNAAASSGGGVSGGTLFNCSLIGNIATNGGAAGSSTFFDCSLISNTAVAYGGGAYNGIMSNCVVNFNVATNGGGVYSAAVINSFLSHNAAISLGGGAYGGSLSNCTILSNTSASGGGCYNSSASHCSIRSNSALGGGGANYGSLLNCVLQDNFAQYYGGGASLTPATNCLFNWNSAGISGGACVGTSGFGDYTPTLLNCTIVGNSALVSAGGVLGGSLTNCIIFFNDAAIDPNCSQSSLNNCCIPPYFDFYGIASNNIFLDPRLVSASHIAATSPCRGAGNPDAVRGLDIDNQPWANAPAIGCDEYVASSNTGPATVAIRSQNLTIAAGWPLKFQADIEGRVSASRWEFNDGTSISNQPAVTHIWTTPGIFPVILRAFNETSPGGISATVNVQVVVQPVYYVRNNNPTPSPLTIHGLWPPRIFRTQLMQRQFPGRWCWLAMEYSQSAGTRGLEI